VNGSQVTHNPCTSNCQPETTDGGDEYHPEPKEDVYLLVVHVDRKNTLNRIAVNVGHILATNLEVAQSDAWKRYVTVLGPVNVVDHAAHDVGSESTVSVGKNLAQEEELANSVADVEDFRNEEQNQ